MAKPKPTAVTTTPAAPATTPPAPVPPPAPEPDVYRPLSLAAVAGLCLGCVCTALVALTTVVALWTRAPLFLAGWLVLLLAVGGAVLSFLGMQQIRYSEGTRAGEKLARYGIWLSLIPGLGYLAYQYFTGLALVQQANRFLVEAHDDDSGFFARLQEAGRLLAEGKKAKAQEQINWAFLLTMPYSRRAGHVPPQEARLTRDFDAPKPSGDDGELTQFRESVIVKTILAGGADTVVEALGVQEWKYEQGIYQVRRTYRVTTPELIWELSLPVFATEGEDSEGKRKWFIAFPRVQERARLTPLGEAMAHARKLSRLKVDSWMTETKKAKKPPSVKEETTDYDTIFPDKLTPVKKRMQAIFTDTDEDFKGLVFPPPPEKPAVWQKLPKGELRIQHDYLVQVHPKEGAGTTAKSVPGFKALVRITVQSRLAYDPQDENTPAPTFDVVDFQVLRVAIVTPGGPKR